MRIALDARWINEEMSGIGRYSLGLIEGLAAINAPHQLILIGGNRRVLAQATLPITDQIEFVNCTDNPLAPQSQIFLPKILRRIGADVYHAPYVHAPLLARRCPVVITVHDLIPLRFSQGLPKSKKARFRSIWNWWCAAQYRRAHTIITVSDFSRKELVEHAGIAPNKIVRIYNGVRGDLSIEIGSSPSFRETFGVRGRIVSYIGRHDPYKNVTGLVCAFAHVRALFTEDTTLVIAGKLDPRYPEAQSMVRELHLEEHILFTDYIDEDMRLALMRESDVFVFPSKYEGFGLPPLEAFVAGVPVVASNAASIPEVVGDAALLVDPDDYKHMAAAIVKVLVDDDLRSRCITAGKAQASKFNWQHCAREHMAVYERTASQSCGRG